MKSICTTDSSPHGDVEKWYGFPIFLRKCRSHTLHIQRSVQPGSLGHIRCLIPRDNGQWGLFYIQEHNALLCCIRRWAVTGRQTVDSLRIVCWLESTSIIGESLQWRQRAERRSRNFTVEDISSGYRKAHIESGRRIKTTRKERKREGYHEFHRRSYIVHHNS